jgi:hypothetical protein
MKFLKVFAVAFAFAVVFAVVFCGSSHCSAQCIDGQCARIGPPVLAAPGPFLGGPVVYAPLVYAAPVCQVHHADEMPSPCHGPPVNFACGSGSGAGCYAPRPWHSSGNFNRGGSVGISLHWGRGCASRSSSGWR